MVSLLYLLTLFHFYIAREFHRREKDKILSFNLESPDSEYFASLDYSDNFEIIDEMDKDEDNDLNFLKIDNSLKVDCLILNINVPAPDKNLLNSSVPSKYCQQNVNLNDDKKLIDYPKNIYC